MRFRYRYRIKTAMFVIGLLCVLFAYGRLEIARSARQKQIIAGLQDDDVNIGVRWLPKMFGIGEYPHEVYISDSRLSKNDLERIAQLRDAKYLTFRDCDLEASLLQRLSAFSQLRYLCVDRCSIVDEHISIPQSLVQLRLIEIESEAGQLRIQHNSGSRLGWITVRDVSLDPTTRS